MSDPPPTGPTARGPYQLQPSSDPERPWQIVTAGNEQVFAFSDLDYRAAVEMLARLNSQH
jgi:hypothetical protein